MRILVVRIGAYGDILITSPFIRYLKSKGHEIVYLGSEQAEAVLQNNPHIDKFILHKRNSVLNHELGIYFEETRKAHDCEKIIDLCESIEVRLAVTDDYPQWNLTKQERTALCNKNYYEYTFTHAGYDFHSLQGWGRSIDEAKQSMRKFFRPEMFFTDEEQAFVDEIRKDLVGARVIMWGLSGSGRQKTYPYVPYISGDLLRDYKDVVMMLVGGETCQILEAGFKKHHRIIKKCGEFTFRQSALMSKYVSLVVSPDTGFLHASGCWDTPKIGLLTHTTIENITKHFTNDFSIESKAPCAPCFRLITDADNQCPLERGTKACYCMSKEGIEPERIYHRIGEALNAMQPV